MTDRMALFQMPYRTHSDGLRRRVEAEMLVIHFCDHGMIERDSLSSPWRVVHAGHLDEAAKFIAQQKSE